MFLFNTDAILFLTSFSLPLSHGHGTCHYYCNKTHGTHQYTYFWKPLLGVELFPSHISGASELGPGGCVKGFLGVRVALVGGWTVTAGDTQGRRASVAKAHILPTDYALILLFLLQWLCCVLV